jgi:hypothetical protein
MGDSYRVLLLFITLAGVLVSATVVAAPMVCSISDKYYCEAGSGCQRMESSTSVRIDPDRKVYSRCDASGCDNFQAQFSQSGDFHHINLANVLAKVSVSDSSFVEIATFDLRTYVSFGKCANIDQ